MHGQYRIIIINFSYERPSKLEAAGTCEYIEKCSDNDDDWLMTSPVPK